MRNNTNLWRAYVEPILAFQWDGTQAGADNLRYDLNIQSLIYNDKSKVLASADYDGPGAPVPEVVVHPTDWVVRLRIREEWIHVVYRDNDFKNKYEPYR